MTHTERMCVKTAGFVLGLLWVLAGCACADGVAVELKESCQVAGPHALLGEVADISGAEPELDAKLRDIPVGAAPLPGKTREMTLAMVRVRLLAAGIDLDSVTLAGAESTTMARLCQVVSGQDIVDKASSAVRSQLPWTEDELDIGAARLPSDVYVPIGNLELACGQEPTFRSFGNMTVPVDLMVDGHHVKTVSVSLQGTLRAQVVVAARDIDRLEIVAPEDVAVKPVEITKAPDSLLLAASDAVGKRATRLIRIGTPITAEMLSEPPAILRGETITVKASVGAVVATTLAQAAQDGKIGQIIKATPIKGAGARIPGGKTSLMVRVTGPGEAEATGLGGYQR